MYNLFVPKLAGNKFDIYGNVIAWYFMLCFIYPFPIILSSVIDKYFNTSYFDLAYSLYSNGLFLLFLVLTFIIISYFIVYTISASNNFIRYFLGKYFFNTWFFNYWKNNKTISGKIYLKRVIILFVLFDIIFLEGIEILEELQDLNSKFFVLWIIMTGSLIIPQLFQDVRRINAVFLNNLSLGKVIFNLMLFLYIVIYFDLVLIKILPNDYPNLSLICALILIAIQFYLIVKNSPITDSKQHEG
tara:strand:- start:44 stop:775 length:732 start_codon:yes stop_codon:yes gene_type:complete